MSRKTHILFPSKMTSIVKRVTGAVGVELLVIIVTMFISKIINHFGVNRISTHHTISTLVPYGFLFLSIIYFVAFIFSIWWVIAGFVLLQQKDNQP